MDEHQDSQLAIYQTDKGEIKIDVKIQDETVWLSLNQIAEVFERDKSVIAKHLKNIFKGGELNRKATVAKFATVQTEGMRIVERQVEYYNLDAILSVGYRVNSKQGMHFRIWASNLLKDYLIKGYNINQLQITNENLNYLRRTIESLPNILTNQGEEGDKTLINLLTIIKTYAKTWDMLVRYDADNLIAPSNLQGAVSGLLNYQEAIASIAVLKKEVGQEDSNLFGLERTDALKAILGNIDQTWGGRPLYLSLQAKAAHLLYFIIKDHPFGDGNKRIGCLLFLLYLSKARIGLKAVGASSMISLALLIAKSDPRQKETMIMLIVNLISDE